MSDKKQRSVRNVSVRLAKGGWTVQVEYEPEETSDDKKKDTGVCCGPSWTPPEDHVFIDRTAMLDYIGECFGGPIKQTSSVESTRKNVKKRLHEAGMT